MDKPRIAFALARTGILLAIACAIAELIAGPGYRMGLWTYGIGIQVMRWSATTDIAAILLALAALVAAAIYRVPGARLPAVIGLVASLGVIAPPLYMWRVVGQVPRIHDISTDTERPLHYVAIAPLRKGTNSMETSPDDIALQKKGYPQIAPAMLDEPPDKAFQRAERAARSMGWEIVAVAPVEGRIEATDTTLLFGFKDDIVIRVSPEGKGSRIDMRSLSRVGRSDFGVNAKRIMAYMKALASA